MFTKLAQLTTANKALEAELAETKGRLAVLEKRAAAEEFLLGIKDDLSAPVSLRPTTPEDFLEKRAALEAHENLQSAELAVKMASRQDFEIGNVADSPPAAQPGEGTANAIFTDWAQEIL
jgi:hypothetical protein